MTLALPSLYQAVVARFAAEAGNVSPLATRDFSGTSAPTLSGAPTQAAEVAVLFAVGGTIGTPGITYAVSTDSGITYGPVTALGSGSTISVLGVTLTLGAGTVASASALSWQQASPLNPDQPFGWREPTHRVAGFRIVWVPGDDANVGAVAPVRFPGRNPRSIATLGELFTVYVEARDASDPLNELVQYTSARLLFDAWWRAVYLAMPGVVSIESIKWLSIGGGAQTLAAVSQAGATIRVTCSIQALIPDAPLSLASALTDATVASTAVIDGTHDQTDTETIAPGDTP